MRANGGGWSELTAQQAKFKPFDLESYARGDLDMSIMPRPLLSPTALETAMEKQAQWTGVNLAVQAGVPVEIVLQDEGWTDEKLAELKAAKAQERQTQQANVQQQVATPDQQAQGGQQ
jgi:hypothetical protein